ncbi:MAG: peptidase E, partial [Lachnospiraceae bacterium]|nr:peptidase E [Lachnospiraceae bacterium]
NNGLIYVGISAGSMYAAGNLEDGLHIIPNPIIPHWNENKLGELPKGEREIQLVDGQAVYIENDNIKLI